MAFFIHQLLAVFVAVSVGQPSPSNPPSNSTPATPTAQKAPALNDLHPTVRPVLTKRAKQCFKLPDGTICDASQYYELAAAMERCTSLQELGYWDNSGLVRRWVKTGETWAVDQSDLAIAWGLTQLGKANFPPGEARRETRPLLLCEHSDERPYFLFVDETVKESYRESQGTGHRSEVLERLKDDIVRVRVDPLGQQELTPYFELYVKVSPEQAKKVRSLPGKYVLWPDKTLPYPRALAQPGQAVPGANGLHLNPLNCVYRFMPLSKQGISTEELIEAVHSNRLPAMEWTFAREGSRIVWTQTPIELRLKNQPSNSQSGSPQQPKDLK